MSKASLHKRQLKRDVQLQAEAKSREYNAGFIVREARAYMHAGMNRAQRRQIAKQKEVFSMPGLWRGLIPQAELKKKTLLKKIVKGKVTYAPAA